MTARPESDFPTIRELRDRLSKLIDDGLGDLAVQALVVPDSTMQAVARSIGGARHPKPALMIDFGSDDGRIPVSMISTERLKSGGGGMPSTRQQ